MSQGLIRALFLVAAGSFLCTAGAQTGVLDQVSPAANAGFNGDAPSLTWQQEVQVGLSGQLEGFSLPVTGPVGAQLNVRVRIGPGWNTTPSVFGTVISKLTANTEVIFVD
jgi:hypothetical protein